MRRWIVTLALIIVLALVAGVGHFGLGWWQPSHSAVRETAGGFDSESKPATLQEVLADAHRSLDEIEHNVRDYSAVIVQEERIDTKLVKTVMFAKIREEPFSVYLYVLDRSDKSALKREVVYVQGKNDGKLIVHTPGLLGFFKMSLSPNSSLAREGQRYSITDIGLANLCRQLIKRGETAGDPREVAVKRYRHARINTRACTLVEIMYPVHDEPKNWGYLARVFLDDELHFPIRVEVHELPADRSKMPQLVEGYTYLDVKINNGYTDADFDPKNPQYKFP
jgi:hypothetical protein